MIGKLVIAAAVAVAALLAPAGEDEALAQARSALDIYVIDVEGGNATLFVAPSGESLLIDTGNVAPAAAVRDAGRIMEAIKDARLLQIDNLIITHWHGDHYGGLAELAKQIRIRHFIDHGPNTQPAPAADEFLAKVYPQLYANAKHSVVKPGDAIGLAGVDVQVVASAGETIKNPLSGAGAPNPYCAIFKDGRNNAEDQASIGVVVTFGKFRAVHLGDLTKNKEFQLMCPDNRIGTVDLFLGLHHGQDTSNSEVMIHATRPRVAIMNNGTRKGGEPDTMWVVHTSPGLEDLWQMHFSQLSGQEYTVPGMFIANLLDDQPAAMPIEPINNPPPGPNRPEPPAHNGPAHWIKVTAQADGTFTVTNTRNGFAKTYEAK
ncbi:MAG TPA: MBL fold metallo-hydrolase [Xanthobacteraceae bacterium]|jgi:beta-lactamase superfamily II metal-dependent hydrolase